MKQGRRASQPLKCMKHTARTPKKAGKVRHIGFSDAPAGYGSRAQTLAEGRDYGRLALLQHEYSLVSRNLEREHAPLAIETGIPIVLWSPLASGFLTGKYRHEGGKIVGAGRAFDYQDSGNPTLETFSKRERLYIQLTRGCA